MKRYLLIRGKRIFCEMAGSTDQNAVLYLHGGPGEGSEQFFKFQEHRLSNALRLITMDQRGVKRSEALEMDSKFGLDDLIQDIEEVRRKLDIETWSIIGHSFGGYLALHYALAYPQSIKKIVLDCPSFDLGLSIRALLKQAALEFLAMNKLEMAKSCFQICEDQTISSDQLFHFFYKTRAKLGARIANLYLFQLTYPFFNQTTDQHGLSNHSVIHLLKLKEEGKIFSSLLPFVSKIEIPTLLFKGKYDQVTCSIQLSSYCQQSVWKEVKIFEKSNHYIWAEEPDSYSEVVTQFLST